MLTAHRAHHVPLPTRGRPVGLSRVRRGAV